MVMINSIHDEDKGMPARPTSVIDNSHGGTAVFSGGIHARVGGDFLGGAQASPEPLRRPVRDESGTPLLVAGCCDSGQHT